MSNGVVRGLATQERVTVCASVIDVEVGPDSLQFAVVGWNHGAKHERKRDDHGAERRVLQRKKKGLERNSDGDDGEIFGGKQASAKGGTYSSSLLMFVGGK